VVTPRCAACGQVTHRRAELWHCRGCGSARVWPPPESTVYDDDYFDNPIDARGYFDNGRVRGWKQTSSRWLLQRIQRFVPAARQPLRVLDFGAGTGELARTCARAGMSIVAVEPIARGRQAIREGGLEAFASLEEAVLSGAFDIVFLTDVIEHLEDPTRCLAQLRRSTAPGGIVVITTPDFGGPWRKLLGSRWPHLKPREHLHYFTRQGVERLLRAVGWHPVHIAAHFKLIAVDYLLRDQGRRGGPAGAVASRLATIARVLPPFPAYLDEMLVVAHAF
jgi:2-polyprenyl-3-methyl-5-hydroxy-6-metoxy-1,4-benzoquinol methylase